MEWVFEWVFEVAFKMLLCIVGLLKREAVCSIS